MLLKNIPTVSETNILEQEILYKDQVLDFNGAFDRTITKCIEQVGEYSLETCIKMILEENPGVLFKIIQYSKRYKKVYFYTDHEISTEAWDKRNTIYTRTLKDNDAIARELYNTLIADNQEYSDCISLYNIRKLLTGIYFQYEKIIKGHQLYVKNAIQRNEQNKIVYVQDITAYGGKIIIEFCSGYSFSYTDYKIVFEKANNNQFYVKESNYYYAEETLKQINRKLPKIYDDCITYQHTQGLFCLDQKIIDSKFLVTINKAKIIVFSIYVPSTCFKNFELSIDYTNNKYQCSNHNKSIIELLIGKEDELLKKLFIKIDDCPSWSREYLYLIRKKQLEKIEKKQKIKKLLFPWKNN